MVPAAERFGLGVMPYYPLAMGLLSGKYTRGKRPARTTRLGSGDDGEHGMLSDDNFDRMERLDAYAADHGHTLLELAIGWLASHEVVSTVICGATKPRQVKANAAAVTAWCMTPDEMDDISEIVGS